VEHLSYSALESFRVPRPVDRLEYIERLVDGKTVFDLGALDETAVDAKKDSGDWLHARLCGRAAKVVGIDNSPLVPSEGLVTRTNGRIINADIFDLSPIIREHGKPDVIVAGELIEHLPNTLELLHSMKQNALLRDVVLVFSTPNACSWHNFLIGLAGRESTHQDHLQIYSYKTLRTLFARAGIDLVSLAPYHASFQEMVSSQRGAAKATVLGFQKVVNALEWLTPVLGAGWIGTARL
jgi:hypothetical protein